MSLCDHPHYQAARASLLQLLEEQYERHARQTADLTAQITRLQRDNTQLRASLVLISKALWAEVDVLSSSPPRRPA